MSRYGRKTIHRKKDNEITEKERDLLRRQIFDHAHTLAEELNLRLLLREESDDWREDALLKGILALAGEKQLWWDLCVTQHILFVECVTVTGIVFPAVREGFLHRLKTAFGRLFRRLRTLLPIKSGNRPITNK